MAGEDEWDFGGAGWVDEIAGDNAEDAAEDGGGVAGFGGDFGEDIGGRGEVGDLGDVGDVGDDEVGGSHRGEFGDERLVLAGEVGDGGHAGGHAGFVGDEGVVVADPKEDGGGLRLDGEGRLTVGDSVAQAWEAEDELVELLLAGCGVDQRDGVHDVVEESSGDGEVGDLRGEVIAAGGGARSCSDDGRGSEGDELEDVGGTGVGDEGLDDVESGLSGEDGGPAVDLRGVEEGSALEAGGEGVAEEDGVGEVAGVLCLLCLEGGELFGCGAAAVVIAADERQREGSSEAGVQQD